MQFSAQPWWFNFGFSGTVFIWSDVFDKLVKWLKEVQKGCSNKYLFLFYCVASGATGFPVEPTWLYIFSLGFKLVHVGVPTFVCNREVLNREFGADSSIQGRFVSECLPRASFNSVGQGRSCFFFKTVNKYLQVKRVGSFWSVRTFKDFKSLFIIGVLFGSIINPLTFKLIARELSAAT